MKRSLTGTIVFAFAVFLISLSTAFGQTERGSIVGTVTDPNGASVANATVTVTNKGNNTSQTIVTNEQGVYNVPFLVPGNYEVMTTASGFSKTVVSDVVVSVGSAQSVNVTLKPGGVNETVEVTNATPLLQTENANIGQVITSQQLTDLPSSNRNIYSFLTLDSTVNNGPTGNAEAFRIESGGSYSIGGTRPSSATFKIDGQANNDPTFGTPTITPSLDTVKEFQLQNNAYSAEFEGITQVNIATKSGTNRFHGSLFEFAQNSAFAPRNPLNPPDASGKPAHNKIRYNQFGGSIGGPVWTPHFGEGGSFLDKDKTFFFFSYEGLRNNQRATAFSRVLTQAERTGDLSSYLGGCIKVSGVDVPQLNPDGTPSGDCVHTGQIFDPNTTVANPLYTGSSPSAFNPQYIRQPFAGNKIPSDRIDPRATAAINVQQPLPNFSTTSADLNLAGQSGNNFVNNQWSIRIDHRLTDRDSIYGRYTWQNNARDGELVLPFQQKNIVGNGRVFNSNWTHVFGPTLVNEFRVGWVRGIYGDSITEIDPKQFGITNTGLNTLPGYFLTSGGLLNYGGFTGSILKMDQTTYQVSDNVSFTWGVHNFKAGFKQDYNHFINANLGTTNGLLNFNGLYSIGNSSLSAARPNSIADFLLGNVSSESLGVAAPASLFNNPWAVYLQDDWRISPQLTVNLGLRYEYHQPYREEHLGGSAVDFSVPGGRLIVADPEVARLANDPRVVCCKERIVDGDKNDFGPRIGAAWRPFKSDDTVIRAGYGIFYADTSQYFHWSDWAPLRGLGSFTPTSGDFLTPSATLANAFPSANFTPPGGSGVSIGISSSLGPGIVTKPYISTFSLGSYKTPQSQEWSIGIQREILNGIVVDLSYKGSVSRNLPLQWYFNQPSFSATPVNYKSSDPAANPYLRRTYDNFSISSNIVSNVLSANYNAATLKVEKRFSKGYSFLSTYTWSKSLDEGAEVFSVVSNYALLPDNRDFKANYGVSVFDVPHRWVTSGTYELPFGKGKPFLNYGGVANALLGGWRLSGVFTLQSGMPFQPSVLGLRTNTGISAIIERGDWADTSVYTAAEWKAAVDAWKNGARLFFIKPGTINSNYPAGTGGNIGRNMFRSPYGRRLDLSLAKVVTLGERMRFEVRMDMFDVTREILHRPSIANSVAALTYLARPEFLGSIPGKNLFFVPYTIQLGGRFTF